MGSAIDEINNIKENKKVFERVAQQVINDYENDDKIYVYWLDEVEKDELVFETTISDYEKHFTVQDIIDYYPIFCKSQGLKVSMNHGVCDSDKMLGTVRAAVKKCIEKVARY